MFSNGKISDRGKSILVWVVAICVFLSLSCLCLYSCKRSVEYSVHAKRNRVTVQLSYPTPDNAFIR